MWDIDNHTPFPETGKFMRDNTGRSLWCVWMRADFVLRPGALPLFATEQMPPVMAPEYLDGDPESVLLRESDLTLPRNNVDLIILADGFSPEKDPTHPFEATVSWGGWKKSAWVHPAQSRQANGKYKPIDGMQPSVPLDWRAAAKGADAKANPLGRAHSKDRGAPQGSLLPQVLKAGDSPEREAQPVSFSPVPPTWPERAKLSGTYDAHWERTRAPILPADLDAAFWQSAPKDQRFARKDVSTLCHSSTALVLSNMTPEGVFSSCIPVVDFDCSVRFKKQWHDVTPELQLIHVDLRDMKLSLVWGFAFPIGASQFDVDVETTVLSLRSTASMRVAPEQAGDFSTNPSQEGAA